MVITKEPEFGDRPQVRDRDGHVWTRVSEWHWRYVRESPDVVMQYQTSWEFLRDLLGPLETVQ